MELSCHQTDLVSHASTSGWAGLPALTRSQITSALTPCDERVRYPNTPPIGRVGTAKQGFPPHCFPSSHPMVGDEKDPEERVEPRVALRHTSYWHTASSRSPPHGTKEVHFKSNFTGWVKLPLWISNSLWISVMCSLRTYVPFLWSSLRSTYCLVSACPMVESK